VLEKEGIIVSILSPQQRGLQLIKKYGKKDKRQVSILSPQQRGLQFVSPISPILISMFQFSAPNKGDCNNDGKGGHIFLACFNSQPPTKGTAIYLGGE